MHTGIEITPHMHTGIYLNPRMHTGISVMGSQYATVNFETPICIWGFILVPVCIQGSHDKDPHMHTGIEMNPIMRTGI